MSAANGTTLGLSSPSRGQEHVHLSLRVLILTVILFLGWHLYAENSKQKKTEAALIDQYGCRPVLSFVPYKWPLALDLLLRQYRILFGDHTFEELTPYFDMAETCCIHLFWLTGYFTTCPENIEAILSTRFEDYHLGSRRISSAPLMGEGVFSQDGPAWKKSRELIRRQFVRVQKQMPQALTAHVDELLEGIAEATADGIVDLRPFMYEYTLSTTAELLFGEPHGNMARDKREAVRDNFDYATFVCGIRVRLADGAWLYNPPKFRAACKAVREWAMFFVDKASLYKDEFGEEAAAEKYSFIVDLWREMRDIELFRFHLIRNPDSLKRLQREISDVPKEGHLTRDQIQKLPFLRCCLNETLRLYPTLPMNIRFTGKTTVLPRGGGPDGHSPVLLPKGSGIVFSVYHLHRLESIYGPDSRTYRPQRWESGELSKKARPGFVYVDFNAGPRLCLGKDFALMEASYAIIRILQKYPNIRLAPGVPIEPVGAEKQTYTIGLSPKDGVHVAL